MDWTARTEGELTGASLSGSNGAANRTYTLTYSNVVENSINIIIDGRPAMKGSDRDYTYSSGIITFVQAIYNDSVIQITYYMVIKLYIEDEFFIDFLC